MCLAVTVAMLGDINAGKGNYFEEAGPKNTHLGWDSLRVRAPTQQGKANSQLEAHPVGQVSLGTAAGGHLLANLIGPKGMGGHAGEGEATLLFWVHKVQVGPTSPAGPTVRKVLMAL
jgi:hypothetical protein